MNRKILTALFILLVICIQFIPVDRQNPPSSGEISAPDNVRTLLRRACFDCHSNQTIWPWYGYIAPVSWLLVHDVEEGREHLNLSLWQSYSQQEKHKLLEEIDKEVRKGKMPLKKYLLLHREAKLTPQNVQSLRDWVGHLLREIDQSAEPD